MLPTVMQFLLRRRLACGFLWRAPIRPRLPQRLPFLQSLPLMPPLLLLLLLLLLPMAPSTVKSLPAGVAGRASSFPAAAPRSQPISLLSMGLLPVVVSRSPMPVLSSTAGDLSRPGRRDPRPEEREPRPGRHDPALRRTGRPQLPGGAAVKPEAADMPPPTLPAVTPGAEANSPASETSQRPRVTQRNGDSSRLVQNGWVPSVFHPGKTPVTRHSSTEDKSHVKHHNKVIPVPPDKPRVVPHQGVASVSSDNSRETLLTVMHPVVHSKKSSGAQHTFTQATIRQPVVADQSAPAASISQKHSPDLRKHHGSGLRKHHSSDLSSQLSAKISPHHSPDIRPHPRPDLSPHRSSELSLQLNPWLTSQLRRNLSSLTNHRRQLPAQQGVGGLTRVPPHLINWDRPGLTSSGAGLEQLLDSESPGISTALTAESGDNLSDVIKALTQYHLIR